jgi:hypothetical protein
LLLCVAAASASETNTSQARIGVYDSRAVAYAHFWSASYQTKLNHLMASAKAAKQSGDTNSFGAKSEALRSAQENSHRQVFSTAPVDDALAAIKDRIPEIKKQAGVSVLVSKWDEKALKENSKAEQVDVTDQLVREFIQPTEKQLKVIESLRKAEPLPLEKCDELIRDGKI